MTSAEAEKLLTKVRAFIFRNEPFYAGLLLRLPFKERPDLPFCMATDGTAIYYNPMLLDDKKEFIVGIVEHEILHNAFLHFARTEMLTGSKAVTDIANMAMDYAINPLCKYHLPNNVLIDAKYKGWHYERIYHDLVKEEKPEEGNGENEGEEGQGQEGNSAPDGNDWGRVIAPTNASGKPLNAEEVKELEAHWEIQTMQAERMSEKAGVGPGEGLVNALGNTRQREVPWEEVMQQFMTDNAPTDWDFTKVDRRNDSEFMMPGMDEPKPNFVLAIDVSGSISQQFLNRFAAAVQQLCDIYASELTVIYCDTEVRHVEQFLQGDTIHFESKGGGGTLCQPVFKYIEREGIDAAACIYLTDLYMYEFGEAPNIPVLWVSWGANSAPWGQVLHIGRIYSE